MIFSGAFLGFYLNPDSSEADGGQGRLLAKIIWFLVFLPGLLFSLRNPWRIGRNLLFREPFMLAMTGLALASCAWTLLPGISLRRALLLLATLQYASYLGSTYSWLELQRLTRHALRWGLLLSCLVALVHPELGRHQGEHQGLWRGLYLHKNSFGRMGALLSTLSLSVSMGGLARSKKLATLDFLLGLAVLGLSNSRTSIGLLMAAAVVLSGLRILLRSASSLRVSMAGLSAAGLAVALPTLPLLLPILAMANWDKLLTGRVTLWKTVYYLASKKFWTGYGYGVFFQDAAFGKLIELFEGWPAPHSHNILLELFTDMGIGAVLLYLCTMALYFWRVTRRPGRLTMIAVGIGSFNLLTGLTETGCYPNSDLTSLLFMMLAMTVSRQDMMAFRSGSTVSEFHRGGLAVGGEDAGPRQPLQGQQGTKEGVET
jgi:O-antigen ligase